MADLKATLEKFKRVPTDVLGIEIEASETRIARIKKNNQETSLVSVAILPSVELPASAETLPPVLTIPPKLKAKYASFAISGESAVIKLLSFPGHFDEAAESKVVDNLGLEKPDDFRISYKLISEGHGKTESRVLAVAIPETEACVFPKLLPSGTPAPVSMEIAGLATISAFLHGPALKHENDAIGVIHYGFKTSTFALFNKNALALIRRFDVGTNSVLEKIQESLGVDRETAQSILTDGAFDISQSVNEVLAPLTKQLVVSRDFVERRENCQISKLYASGGLTQSRDSLDEMSSSMGIDAAAWNPVETLTIQDGAVPPEYQGQEWKFSAAIGSALSTLEEA